MNEFDINEEDTCFFKELLNIEKNKEWIQIHFPSIINAVERTYKANRFGAIKVLFEEIEGSELASDPAYIQFKKNHPPRWEGAI